MVKATPIMRGFLFSLFGTSIMWGIVESEVVERIVKVCEIVLFFPIAQLTGFHL